MMRIIGLIFSFQIIRLVLATPEFCPQTCKCSRFELACNKTAIRDVPLNFSDEIQEVHLFDFNFNGIEPGIFRENVLWARIKTLIIYSSHGKTLCEDAFDGLVNTTFLGLHSEQLQNVSNELLRGLDNIECLDFDGAIKLEPKWFLPAIGQFPLPLLRNVSLAGLNSFNLNTIEMTDYFFIMVTFNGTRNIHYFDASNTFVSDMDFGLLHKYNICNSIKELKMRYIVLTRARNFLGAPCKSLRKLDMKGFDSPVLRKGITFNNTGFSCIGVLFYNNIEEYILDDIISKADKPIVISDFQLNMSQCLMHVKRVSGSNNRMHYLNITASLNNVTVESFEFGNFSNNDLQYASPALLRPSVNMKTLDLSFNQLSNMQQKYPKDLNDLFSHNINLKYINLASNNLNTLSQKMFEHNTALEHVDISLNNLKHLDSIGLHLRRLKYLKVSQNAIKHLSKQEKKIMNEIYTNSNTSLKIDLSGNPFVCTCTSESLATIEWLNAGSGTYLVGDDDQYTCSLEGKRIQIIPDALSKTKTFCRRKKMIMELIIATPTVTFVLVLVAVILIIRSKIKAKNFAFETVLSQLRNGSFRKEHLVFLSFCSEDVNVAVDIKREMKRKMRDIYRISNDNLICSGDTHFRPGLRIGDEMIRCIGNSAVVVFVVSNDFCQKDWCRREIRESFDQNKPTIIFLVDHVDPSLMDTTLQNLYERTVHVSCRQSGIELCIQPSWNVVCKTIISLATKSLIGADRRNSGREDERSRLLN